MPEFSLRIRPDHAQHETDLRLTDTAVVWGKERIALQDVTGLKYGFNRIPGTTGTVYFFTFKSRLGKDLNVGFSTRTEMTERAQSLYTTLEAQMQEFYGNRLLQEWTAKLKRGGEIRIGAVTMTKKGVTLEQKGVLRTLRFEVTWENLGFGAKIVDGYIDIGDKLREKSVISFNIYGEFNGHYLLQMLDRLKNDKAFRQSLAFVR